MLTWVRIDTPSGVRVVSPSFSEPPVVNGIAAVSSEPIGVYLIDSVVDLITSEPMLLMVNRCSIEWANGPLPSSRREDPQNQDRKRELVITAGGMGTGTCVEGLEVLTHYAQYVMQQGMIAAAKTKDSKDDDNNGASSGMTNRTDKRRSIALYGIALAQQQMDALCTLLPRPAVLEEELIEDDGIQIMNRVGEMRNDASSSDSPSTKYSNRQYYEKKAPIIYESQGAAARAVQSGIHGTQIDESAAVPTVTTALMPPSTPLRTFHNPTVGESYTTACMELLQQWDTMSLYRRSVLLFFVQKDVVPVSLLYCRSLTVEERSDISAAFSATASGGKALLSHGITQLEPRRENTNLSYLIRSPLESVQQMSRKKKDSITPHGTLLNVSRSVSVRCAHVAEMLLCDAFPSFAHSHSSFNAFFSLNRRTDVPSAAPLPLVPFFCVFSPSGLVLPFPSENFYAWTSHVDRVLMCATALDFLTRRTGTGEDGSVSESVVKTIKTRRASSNSSRPSDSSEEFLCMNAIRCYERVMVCGTSEKHLMHLVWVVVGDGLCFAFAFSRKYPPYTNESRTPITVEGSVASSTFATFIRSEILCDSTSSTSGSFVPLCPAKFARPSSRMGNATTDSAFHAGYDIWGMLDENESVVEQWDSSIKCHPLVRLCFHSYPKNYTSYCWRLQTAIQEELNLFGVDGKRIDLCGTGRHVEINQKRTHKKSTKPWDVCGLCDDTEEVHVVTTSVTQLQQQQQQQQTTPARMNPVLQLCLCACVIIQAELTTVNDELETSGGVNTIVRSRYETYAKRMKEIHFPCHTSSSSLSSPSSAFPREPSTGNYCIHTLRTALANRSQEEKLHIPCSNTISESGSAPISGGGVVMMVENPLLLASVCPPMISDDLILEHLSADAERNISGKSKQEQQQKQKNNNKKKKDGLASKENMGGEDDFLLGGGDNNTGGSGAVRKVIGIQSMTSLIPRDALLASIPCWNSSGVASTVPYGNPNTIPSYTPLTEMNEIYSVDDYNKEEELLTLFYTVSARPAPSSSSSNVDPQVTDGNNNNNSNATTINCHTKEQRSDVFESFLLLDGDRTSYEASWIDRMIHNSVPGNKTKEPASDFLDILTVSDAILTGVSM